MKNRIRLTESDLHRIVRESVNKILSEVSGMPNTRKGKYVPAYWEKGEPRRERSDYDDNEEFVTEGWFGNDKRYGEKWWNPNTWMSDKEKREKDRIDKTLRGIYNKRKEWDKEREEAEYQRKMQMSHQKHSTKTSPDVEKRTGYGDTTFGPADDGYFAGLR